MIAVVIFTRAVINPFWLMQIIIFRKFLGISISIRFGWEEDPILVEREREDYLNNMSGVVMVVTSRVGAERLF
jgi:hypothetical protein